MSGTSRARTTDSWRRTRTTGHQWLTPNGRYSLVAVEGPGSLVIVDNRTGLTAASYQYPGGGKPHGVFFEPAEPADEEDDAGTDD